MTNIKVAGWGGDAALTRRITTIETVKSRSLHSAAETAAPVGMTSGKESRASREEGSRSTRYARSGQALRRRRQGRLRSG